MRETRRHLGCGSLTLLPQTVEHDVIDPARLKQPTEHIVGVLVGPAEDTIGDSVADRSRHVGLDLTGNTFVDLHLPVLTVPQLTGTFCLWVGLGQHHGRG